MIVDMKFLTITGPKDDIDRVTEKYISKYEIHLENALSELKDVQKLRPFVSTNPYKEPYAKILSYEKYINFKQSDSDNNAWDFDSAIQLLDEADTTYREIEEQKNELTTQLDKLNNMATSIYPFRVLNPKSR